MKGCWVSLELYKAMELGYKVFFAYNWFMNNLLIFCFSGDVHLRNLALEGIHTVRPGDHDWRLLCGLHQRLLASQAASGWMAAGEHDRPGERRLHRVVLEHRGRGAGQGPDCQKSRPADGRQAVSQHPVGQSKSIFIYS